MLPHVQENRFFLPMKRNNKEENSKRGNGQSDVKCREHTGGERKGGFLKVRCMISPSLSSWERKAEELNNCERKAEEQIRQVEEQ